MNPDFELQNSDDQDEEDWTNTEWSTPDISSVCDSTKTGSGKDTSRCLQTEGFSDDSKKTKLSSADKTQQLTRLHLNDNKAGMEGLDKEKINKIIYEASKGSKYFINERKKEEQLNKRIKEQTERQKSISELDMRKAVIEADHLLEMLERTRDLDHVIVHVDMDAYYAAVEMREDVSLRHKPIAVGSNSMLSTSNYLARKFGVRAAMPGFIGKKLCPELTIVSPNFKKYTEVSSQVREIFALYDPNYCPVSLDEAYLDFTNHIKERQTMSVSQRTVLCRTNRPDDVDVCLCDLNTFSHLLLDSGGVQEKRALSEKGSNLVCQQCGKLYPPFELKVFDMTVEGAVSEMRCRIEQRTRLTASAGIAPNMLLAKVCSDKNKPNGQYRITPTRETIMSFIRELPIRKICGIGKVTEKMLNAAGVVSCEDLYHKRALLYHLYSPISFNYFMRICLGLGSTTVNRDGERKSMSTERTFSEINKPADLFDKCRELCQSLAEDLKKAELKGRTVTVKMKTVQFEVKTRAVTLQENTSHVDVIYSAASELLKTEIHNTPGLALRLMGVRMSNLTAESQAGKQDTITGMFKKLHDKSVHSDHTLSSLPAEECSRHSYNSDVLAASTASTENKTGCNQSEKCLSGNHGSVSLSKENSSEESNLSLVSEERENEAVYSTLDNSQIKTQAQYFSRLPTPSTSSNVTNKTDVEEFTQTDHHVNHSKSADTSKCGEFYSKQRGTLSENSHKKSYSQELTENFNETEDKENRVELESRLCAEDKQGEEKMLENSEQQEHYFCPVCSVNVACNNLNYFNDHVDLCLIKQSATSDHLENTKNCDIATDSSANCRQSGSTLSCLGKSDTNSIDIAISSLTKCKESETEKCEEEGSSEVTDDTAHTKHFYTCPVCHLEKHDWNIVHFNQHVDTCLSTATIKQILKEEDNQYRKNKRHSCEDQAVTKSKRGRHSGKTCNIKTFFTP